MGTDGRQEQAPFSNILKRDALPAGVNGIDRKLFEELEYPVGDTLGALDDELTAFCCIDG